MVKIELKILQTTFQKQVTHESDPIWVPAVKYNNKKISFVFAKIKFFPSIKKIL